MSKRRRRHARISRLLDVAGVENARITILGLGRLGFPVAEHLVRHGVATKAEGRMRLVDGDTVDEPNLVVGYMTDSIGKPKPTATVEILLGIDPGVNLSQWHHILTEQDIPAVEQMARDSTAMLIAIDDSIALDIANACHQHCPIVMGHFGFRADSAEVAFSTPDTAPISAVMGRRERQRLDGAQALGCDVVFVASFVSALMLRLIVGDGRGKGLFPYAFANANLFVVGVRRIPLLAHQPSDIVRSIIVVGAPLPHGS